MFSPAPEPVNEKTEVRCYFVRKRNALAVRAQVSPLYVDYYLHLAQHGLSNTAVHDGMLKDGLAALLLHLASKPWNERYAWTFNFQNPLLNLFVTGDSRTAQITGRVFTDNVKRAEHPMMYSQLQTPTVPIRQSVVEIESSNLFQCVEDFYVKSEQRRGRFFFHDPEDIVFITAQPQCDLAWLESLNDEQVKRLDQDEELSLLETRYYEWGCGCSAERLFEVMAPHARDGLDLLFADEDSLNAACPRCGATYTISRGQFEEWLRLRGAEESTAEN